MREQTFTTPRGVLTAVQTEGLEWGVFTTAHEFLGAVQVEDGSYVTYFARERPKLFASLEAAVRHIGGGR